ncbi:MAG: hypothetical protein IIT61_03310 [Bacteroidales bacterium]|nr:hypothetical protein [Bacteroidales bacterium]MBQ2351515.1 hypothetical protein [Bacteroidales bacterium]MBQ2573970.1 hypothetical protein [Bacteroidales bacterium]MBQ5423935.1 hypothetical protein [Bacteroidales bacterium]MBQ5457732.1 hypothetical protein [Bacteroidales bacterium]
MEKDCKQQLLELRNQIHDIRNAADDMQEYIDGFRHIVDNRFLISVSLSLSELLLQISNPLSDTERIITTVLKTGIELSEEEIKMITKSIVK